MGAPFSHLSLLSLLLRTLTLVAAGEDSFSLPLIFRHPVSPQLSNPFERIAGLASASLLRADLLKKSSTTAAALFPHSYGGYSINADFGTPPQEIPLLFDTGSQLTWIPCTGKYLCQNCSSPENPAGKIPTFSPKQSSTSKLIGCKNTKCGWIHSPEFLTSCRNCVVPSNSSSDNICPQICPPYLIIYGSGSTTGLLLSETLRFSTRTVAAHDFVVGCSVFSDKQPAGGVAGFGRGVSSIPAQLRLKSFSYCLIPRKLDDSGERGFLELNGGVALNYGDGGIVFTPLLKNPIATAAASAFSVYYYVGLRKITVGGKKVKIPSTALALGRDGNGGTIVDSGTTFTFIEPAIFEPLAAAFVDQVGLRLNRSGDVERDTGLKPCFDLPDGTTSEVVSMPALAFHFKGGAKMRLPLENYFAFVGNSRPTICLTVVSGGGVVGIEGSGGPAMILGSFQQQNYNMIFDLERERLGIQQKSCIAR
ncbi:Aspartic proteinase nepenthesin-2 [Platanthera guangdongensis]|uniref:Aspartic proteinase nepenthesin-2 n=1 Tax=Platanthera guangdongensis TaxID=2320717 RepID=A0ABR2LUW0_9ASPA